MWKGCGERYGECLLSDRGAAAAPLGEAEGTCGEEAEGAWFRDGACGDRSAGIFVGPVDDIAVAGGGDGDAGPCVEGTDWTAGVIGGEAEAEEAGGTCGDADTAVEAVAGEDGGGGDGGAEGEVSGGGTGEDDGGVGGEVDAATGGVRVYVPAVGAGALGGSEGGFEVEVDAAVVGDREDRDILEAAVDDGCVGGRGGADGGGAGSGGGGEAEMGVETGLDGDHYG